MKKAAKRKKRGGAKTELPPGMLSKGLATTEVELVPLDAIKPDPANPHIADVEAIKASIRRREFYGVILVQKSSNRIIAGEHRWRAACQLADEMGITHVPVMWLDVSDDEAKAIMIDDNALVEAATWNEKELHELLEELDVDAIVAQGQCLARKILDERVETFGFGGGAGGTEPDEVPEPPEEPTTQPGDLYVLGEHRLLCGDAGKPEDLDRLLGGAVIHLVNTDPPYNAKVQPRTNTAIAVAGAKAGHQQRSTRIANLNKGKPCKAECRVRPRDRVLEGDYLSDEEFAERLDGWFGNMARVMRDGGVFYVWGVHRNTANYLPILKEHGLHVGQALIWHKKPRLLRGRDFLVAHEWCFYGWKSGAAHNFYGPPNVQDIWHVGSVAEAKMVHLTEKPVELATLAMQYSSRPGENVLDLFAGSGSTLIAGEQLGRRVYAMELDPLYCDVIVERWERFTGRRAERQTGTRVDQKETRADRRTTGRAGKGKRRQS